MTESSLPPDMDDQVQIFLRIWNRARLEVVGANLKPNNLHGLSSVQFALLRLLKEFEDRQQSCTIGLLAQKLSLDPAAIVRSVDSLEKHELVVRRRDTKDRRQVFVEVTEVGHTLFSQLQGDFSQRLAARLKAMSETGRSALIAGLEEFVNVQLPETPE